MLLLFILLTQFILYSLSPVSSFHHELFNSSLPIATPQDSFVSYDIDEETYITLPTVHHLVSSFAQQLLPLHNWISLLPPYQPPPSSSQYQHIGTKGNARHFYRCPSYTHDSMSFGQTIFESFQSFHSISLFFQVSPFFDWQELYLAICQFPQPYQILQIIFSYMLLGNRQTSVQPFSHDPFEQLFKSLDKVLNFQHNSYAQTFRKYIKKIKQLDRFTLLVTIATLLHQHLKEESLSSSPSLLEIYQSLTIYSVICHYTSVNHLNTSLVDIIKQASLNFQQDDFLFHTYELILRYLPLFPEDFDAFVDSKICFNFLFKPLLSQLQCHNKQLFSYLDSFYSHIDWPPLFSKFLSLQKLHLPTTVSFSLSPSNMTLVYQRGSTPFTTFFSNIRKNHRAKLSPENFFLLVFRSLHMASLLAEHNYVIQNFDESQLYVSLIDSLPYLTFDGDSIYLSPDASSSPKNLLPLITLLLKTVPLKTINNSFILLLQNDPPPSLQAFLTLLSKRFVTQKQTRKTFITFFDYLTSRCQFFIRTDPFSSLLEPFNFFTLAVLSSILDEDEDIDFLELNKWLCTSYLSIANPTIQSYLESVFSPMISFLYSTKEKVDSGQLSSFLSGLPLCSFSIDEIIKEVQLQKDKLQDLRNLKSKQKRTLLNFIISSLSSYQPTSSPSLLPLHSLNLPAPPTFSHSHTLLTPSPPPSQLSPSRESIIHTDLLNSSQIDDTFDAPQTSSTHTSSLTLEAPQLDHTSNTLQTSSPVLAPKNHQQAPQMSPYTSLLDYSPTDINISHPLAPPRLPPLTPSLAPNTVISTLEQHLLPDLTDQQQTFNFHGIHIINDTHKFPSNDRLSFSKNNSSLNNTPQLDDKNLDKDRPSSLSFHPPIHPRIKPRTPRNKLSPSMEIPLKISTPHTPSLTLEAPQVSPPIPTIRKTKQQLSSPHSPLSYSMPPIQSFPLDSLMSTLENDSPDINDAREESKSKGFDSHPSSFLTPDTLQEKDSLHTKEYPTVKPRTIFPPSLFTPTSNLIEPQTTDTCSYLDASQKVESDENEWITEEENSDDDLWIDLDSSSLKHLLPDTIDPQRLLMNKTHRLPSNPSLDSSKSNQLLNNTSSQLHDKHHDSETSLNPEQDTPSSRPQRYPTIKPRTPRNKLSPSMEIPLKISTPHTPSLTLETPQVSPPPTIRKTKQQLSSPHSPLSYSMPPIQSFPLDSLISTLENDSPDINDAREESKSKGFDSHPSSFLTLDTLQEKDSLHTKEYPTVKPRTIFPPSLFTPTSNLIEPQTTDTYSHLDTSQKIEDEDDWIDLDSSSDEDCKKQSTLKKRIETETSQDLNPSRFIVSRFPSRPHLRSVKIRSAFLSHYYALQNHSHDLETLFEKPLLESLKPSRTSKRGLPLRFSFKKRRPSQKTSLKRRSSLSPKHSSKKYHSVKKSLSVKRTLFNQASHSNKNKSTTLLNSPSSSSTPAPTLRREPSIKKKSVTCLTLPSSSQVPSLKRHYSLRRGRSFKKTRLTQKSQSLKKDFLLQKSTLKSSQPSRDWTFEHHLSPLPSSLLPPYSPSFTVDRIQNFFFQPSPLFSFTSLSTDSQQTLTLPFVHLPSSWDTIFEQEQRYHSSLKYTSFPHSSRPSYSFSFFSQCHKHHLFRTPSSHISSPILLNPLLRQKLSNFLLQFPLHNLSNEDRTLYGAFFSDSSFSQLDLLTLLYDFYLSNSQKSLKTLKSIFKNHKKFYLAIQYRETSFYFFVTHTIISSLYSSFKTSISSSELSKFIPFFVIHNYFFSQLALSHHHVQVSLLSLYSFLQSLDAPTLSSSHQSKLNSYFHQISSLINESSIPSFSSTPCYFPASFSYFLRMIEKARYLDHDSSPLTFAFFKSFHLKTTRNIFLSTPYFIYKFSFTSPAFYSFFKVLSQLPSSYLTTHTKEGQNFISHALQEFSRLISSLYNQGIVIQNFSLSTTAISFSDSPSDLSSYHLLFMPQKDLSSPYLFQPSHPLFSLNFTPLASFLYYLKFSSLPLFSTQDFPPSLMNSLYDVLSQNEVIFSPSFDSTFQIQPKYQEVFSFLILYVDYIQTFILQNKPDSPLLFEPLMSFITLSILNGIFDQQEFYKWIQWTLASLYAPSFSYLKFSQPMYHFIQIFDSEGQLLKPARCPLPLNQLRDITPPVNAIAPNLLTHSRYFGKNFPKRIYPRLFA